MRKSQNIILFKIEFQYFINNINELNRNKISGYGDMTAVSTTNFVPEVGGIFRVRFRPQISKA